MTGPPPYVLLSCGGYRSGSTYLYNLLGEYAERANLGRRIGYVEPWHAPLLVELRSMVEALGLAVAKSHDAPARPDAAPGSAAWVRLLDAGLLLPVCTVRDFRDVLHSFSRTFGESPEQVLASRRWGLNADNLRWWRGHGALLVPYEGLVPAPGAVLERVAQAAGRPLVPAAALAAARAVAPEQAGAAAARQDPGTIDARTLLHADHVADPQGGGWRQWEPGRMEGFRERLEPLMTDFGYAWG